MDKRKRKRPEIGSDDAFERMRADDMFFSSPRKRKKYSR